MTVKCRYEALQNIIVANLQFYIKSVRGGKPAISRFQQMRVHDDTYEMHEQHI